MTKVARPLMLLLLWASTASVVAQDGGPEAQGLQRQESYAPYPDPASGYVTDLATLLTSDEQNQLEQWLWQVEKQTGVEVAVVTIRSITDYPKVDASTIEQFARGLFNAYGIGNRPRNDGVLLLVARDDRKARIELGAGYSSARDRDATAIMQGVIVPHFKKLDYGEGITEGVRAITRTFAGVRVGGGGLRMNWSLILWPMAIVFVGLVAFSLFKNGKRGWGWLFVGVLILLVMIPVRFIVWVLSHTGNGRHYHDDSYYGGGSSWSSGGDGGGSGGGFGGGSSDGGGSTGSW